MREYHKNLFHSSKGEMDSQKMEAAKLIHKMNKEKRERERHLKEVNEHQAKEHE